MKSRTIIFIVFLTMLLTINSIAETVAPFTVLTHASSGIINTDNSILVRFSKSIKGFVVGKPLKADFFEITPDLKGRAFFKDEYNFEFKPETGFETNKSYSYRIDLSKIFKETEFTSNIVRFDFRTPERVLRKISSTLESNIEDPQNSLRIKISVEMSSYTSVDLINNGCFFTLDNKPVIFYANTKDNLNFEIISQPVMRQKKDFDVNFYIDSKKLNMISNSNIRVKIPSIKEMEVQKTEALMNGNTLYAQIVFSEPVKKGFDLDGFIYVEGLNHTRFRIENNIIYIYSNFINGREYKIKVREGIRSEYGNISKISDVKSIIFPDMQPEVSFTQEGSLLSGLNSEKIVIKTVNTEKVKMSVRKVYANNIAFFLQDNDISGDSDYYYNSHRTGEEIYKQDIYIGKEKNDVIRTEIDISSILSEHRDGFFIISVGFDDYREKVTLKEGNYYSNAVRPVVRTDIGLTAKKSKDRIIVYAMNVKDSLPLSSVKFKLYSYYNQLIDIGFSDERGRYEFDNFKDAFFMTAEWNNMQSFIKFNSSINDTTIFNTGGISTEKNINAYIFAEKGVYRPGENINLTVILRDNENNVINDRLPVKMELFNSTNKRIGEKTAKTGQNGFYTVDFKTETNDVTGVWKAVVEVGPERFEHKILVEDIMPQNIKVEVNKDLKFIKKGNKKIRLDIFSEYLYKAPAKDLLCEIFWNIKPYEIKFDDFSSFSFSGKNSSQIYDNNEIIKKKLNENGKTSHEIAIPAIQNADSGMIFNAEIRVIEKSGRSVSKTISIPYFVYDNYTGIRSAGGGSDYIKTGKSQRFDIVRIDRDQNILKNEPLKYRIYKNQRWWWWDYSSKGDYRKHYKNSLTTELIYEGDIIVDGKIATIEYTPEEWGEYLIEVIPQNKDDKHIATLFFGAYSWGSQARVDEGVLESGIDKKIYEPGEIVSIPVKTPGKGRAWISVENGNKIIWENWVDINKKDMRFDIQVLPEMIPNAYVFITIIQPQENKENDLPLRLYTVREIKVNSKDRKIDYSIECDSVFKPGKEFTLNIKTADKKGSTFTISIIDEGTLGLTNYKTPSPYNYFYQKRALNVVTMDILKDVIQKDKGIIHKYFKTGGSDMEQEISKRSSPVISKRIEPVTLYSGIRETDKNGEAVIDFKMPQYTGAVRIMITGANNNAFGSYDKTVPVRNDFIINASMPLFISPGDRFNSFLQIISTEKNAECDLHIITDEKLISKNKTIKLNLKKGVENTQYIEFEATEDVGNSEVEFVVEYKGEKYSQKINIPVRPEIPYTSIYESNILRSAKSADIWFGQKGFAGTVSKNIKITAKKSPDFRSRFNNIMSYSYSSLYSIVSTGFALIETDNISADMGETVKTEKINKIISKIDKYQLFNGGFANYQNYDSYDLKLTSYAGHFLSEAVKKGYYVSQRTLELWKNFEKRQCANPEGNLKDRVYRVFVLADSGIFEYGEMNIIYQNSIKKLDSGLKAMLAYSYIKAGNLNVGRKILSDIQYKEIISVDSSIGSSLSKAVFLKIYVMLKNEKEIHKLYSYVVDEFNSDKWLSDFDTVYIMNVLNSYNDKYSNEDTFSAEIIIGNNSFEIDDLKEWSYNIESDIDEIKVLNRGKGDLFWYSSWRGVPLNRDYNEGSYGGIEIARGFYNRQGDIFNSEETVQGDVFKIVIDINNKLDRKIENIVLTQIIPAGWEIINPSYNGNVLSGNYNNYTIRDDRVIWFFDLYSNEKRTFEFDVTSTLPGKYILPKAYCETVDEHGINAFTKSYYIKVHRHQ